MCIIAAVLANFNLRTGISEEINETKLISLHDKFKTLNGKTWLRTFKVNGKVVMHKTKNGKIKFTGYKEENHHIPNFVKKAFNGATCVLTGSKNVEIDHKNGRYTKTNLDVADFQALSKSCNDIKRERCKKCKETNCRPKCVGFDFDYLTGEEKFCDNSLSDCKSCFWGNIENYRKLAPLKVNLMKIAISKEYEKILYELLILFDDITNAKYHDPDKIFYILNDFDRKEQKIINKIAKNTTQSEAEALDKEVREHMYKIWGISLITYTIN